MDYFFNCQNESEAKKIYRQLSKLYHPDAGGCVADMQKLNLSYKDFLDKLHSTVDAGEEIYSDLVIALLKFQGLIVEITGVWLWVSGNTRQYADQLKELKLRWAPKKKMWYYRAEEFACKNRVSKDIDYIRQKYGSKSYSYKHINTGA
jgi:hypothetical protein